mmetsp:Transcript_5828/g.9325  ORF Transcript_5828/g.9325 Transcript_5828/m.9325 type:complete len:166 (+) Transcript_5828:3-500(+)
MTDPLQRLNTIKKIVRVDPSKYKDTPFKETLAASIYEVTVDDPIFDPLSHKDIQIFGVELDDMTPRKVTFVFKGWERATDFFTGHLVNGRFFDKEATHIVDLKEPDEVLVSIFPLKPYRIPQEMAEKAKDKDEFCELTKKQSSGLVKYSNYKQGETTAVHTFTYC